jgi:gamma-glutamylcyclotransferase (GGCT)/AIG2-like uncharacterized protein YtfP
MLSYFAYGSNMSRARMARRVKGAQLLGVAVLVGSVLRWHKRSTDGSGKCDAFETGRSTDRVIGVLYQIDESQSARLDEVEGVGHGYRRKGVNVASSTATVAAITYVASPDCIDSTVRPYEWYKEHVLSGAREHGLPSDYVAMIERVQADADPDPARSRRERQICGTSLRT